MATSYPILGLGGDIGHVEDFLTNDEIRPIDYVIVATKNPEFGKHGLVSPTEISGISWAQYYIRVKLTRYKIKCSPSWEEPDWFDPTAGL